MDIRELVSYRLQKATFYVTKPAYQIYSRQFEITGVEWRLMGNLYADGPMSLARVSDESDVQLAQASRTISSLIERDLVRSEIDERDARSVRLSLTPGGRQLYRQMFARAVDLNEFVIGELTAEELSCLYRALDKIADAGRRLLERDKAD